MHERGYEAKVRHCCVPERSLSFNANVSRSMSSQCESRMHVNRDRCDLEVARRGHDSIKVLSRNYVYI